MSTATETHALHSHFLEILPRIELHGRIYFRFLRCSQQREEALAEMIALSWKWFQSLVERGKDPARFPSALATFAARAVKSGRRLRRLGQRNRRVAEEMALGHQTRDMAKKYGLSSARISQLRRELHADWMRFCDVPCLCPES